MKIVWINWKYQQNNPLYLSIGVNSKNGTDIKLSVPSYVICTLDELGVDIYKFIYLVQEFLVHAI